MLLHLRYVRFAVVLHSLCAHSHGPVLRVILSHCAEYFGIFKSLRVPSQRTRGTQPHVGNNDFTSW